MHRSAKPHPGLGPPTCKDLNVVRSRTWHGTAPHLRKKGPKHSLSRPDLLQQIQYTLILVEIGFYMDLGCDIKFDKKTEKYSPLLTALGKYWEKVEIVAFPIGHADTTLTRTHLTVAFSTVRP